MNRAGKRWYVPVVAALAPVLVVSAFSASPAAAKDIKRVKPSALGIHVFDKTQPQVPTGSIRLNCFPTWSEIQKSPGQYDWSKLDEAVNLAQSWGYKDILYVFCGTPLWAVGNQQAQFPTRTELTGDARNTLPPSSMSSWKSFVTAVAKRYKGKITSYQTWNEITSPDFYQGTGKQMAKMTKVAYKAIRKADPRAAVISASVQTHTPVLARYKSVAEPYFAGLKKAKWPVTHMSGHFYPAGVAGPDQRLKQINMYLKSMRKYGLPNSKEIWDTESNFVVGQSKAPNSAVSAPVAATYVARNYLDAWRSGLTRSYWYQWSTDWAPFPGVQLRPGDPATAAFNTFGGWVTGAKFRGCSEKGKLVVCNFSKGGTFQIAFTEKGKSKYRIGGKKTVCPIYPSPVACSAKKKVKVTTIPVKIG
jgi:hypothetical protein